MKRHDKQFKKEAVKLSKGIGVRRAAEQLGCHIIHCRAGGGASSRMEMQLLSAAGKRMEPKKE